MATTTIRNSGGTTVLTHIVQNGTYTDVITSIPGATVAGLLRNLSPYQIVVVKGGASAPDASSQGEILKPFAAVYCETDHIWVTTRNSQNSPATVAYETL
jgi:hypothetical protein